MSMTREAIYSAWVPDLPDDECGMAWTCWAKPVLFANMGTSPVVPHDGEPPGSSTRSDQRGWSGERFAVVIDLPGPESVRRGMEFAELGFRPVPLFNGCPGPGELVDTAAIMKALESAAVRLSELKIALDAPPVFLLDSLRMTPGTMIAPGRFDNRWLTLPQDFPSANLLLGRKISKVVLVQQQTGQPKDDLAHVLRRWQERGIRISIATGSDASKHEDLEVHRPSRFKSLWYRLKASLGLHPNSAGGFGGVIPQPSAG